MKDYLTKITDKYYIYNDKDSGHIYTLKKGSRGIHASGKAYYLEIHYNAGGYDCVATMTIKDDGYKCYLKDHFKRIWKENEVLEEANHLISLMKEA